MPVLLDEYIKNRDIWRCPSAKIETRAAWIVPSGRGGYWVNSYIDHVDTRNSVWGDDANSGPCYQGAWPSGWGGTLTDSLVQGGGLDASQSWQGAAEDQEGAFAYSIAVIGASCCPDLEMYWGKKFSVIEDPSSAAVIVDGSHSATRQPWAGAIAYPDTCGNPNIPCGRWGINGCFWAPGHDDFSDSEYGEFLAGGPLEKSLTRHLGGINVGYADGHAAWTPSREFIRRFNDGELYGPAQPPC